MSKTVDKNDAIAILDAAKHVVDRAGDLCSNLCMEEFEPQHVHLFIALKDALIEYDELGEYLEKKMTAGSRANH